MGRRDGGSDDDIVWQNCPGCQDPNNPKNSLGYIIIQRTDKHGNTRKETVQCSGCRGSGQIRDR